MADGRWHAYLEGSDWLPFRSEPVAAGDTEGSVRSQKLVAALKSADLLAARADPEVRQAEHDAVIAPRWSVYLQAMDWLAADGDHGSEVNGSRMARDIAVLLSQRGEDPDRSFVIDPEGDGLSLTGNDRDALVAFVGALQTAGLLDSTVDPAQVADRAESESLSSTTPAGPVHTGAPALHGPSERYDGGLRAYAPRSVRSEWATGSIDRVVDEMRSALHGAGLGDRIEVEADGENGVTLDGTDVADFERAAQVLGFSRLDRSET